MGGRSCSIGLMVLNRTGRAILLALAAVLLLLRFVHLNTDYPRNIRWDDGIATDEGWYASSAVDQQTWGTWLLPGDMNIPVLMPVWSVIADGAFHLFGFSATTLRATVACLFLLCVLELCLILRHFGARDSIPLFLLMIAANPWAFAFSRSGFLEFPMLSLCLLAMLLCLRRNAEGGDSFRIAGAGLVFAAAVLLKSTGIALMPPVLYLLLQQREFARRAWRDAVVFVAIFAVAIAAYWMSFVRWHPADVRFYLSVVQDSFHYWGVRFLADASRPFRYGLGSDHGLFLLALIVLPVSVFSERMRGLWRKPLFALCGVWLVCFLGFMVKHNNDPARYFALTIPAVLILALALVREIESTAMRKALLVLIAVDVMVNVAQVGAAMLHPSYSFHNASVAIGGIVRADADHSQVVIGDDAHEVVLQNGLRPVNLLYHSADITELMQRYQPGWWLQFDHEDNGGCFAQVLSQAYTAEKRGEWTILKPGEHLILWRLEPIPGAHLPQRLTPAQRKACLPPI